MDASRPRPRRRRRRCNEAEAEDDIAGDNDNSDDAAMAMLILSTDLSQHGRTAVTSPVVDGSDSDADNDAHESESTTSGNSSSSSAESSDTDAEENESHFKTEDEDDNDKENDIVNDGLSEYERLRLKNIERNQQRLASLGLLRTEEKGSIQATTKAPASSSSRKRKDSLLLPPPRRSLPRRRCSMLKRTDSDVRTSAHDDDDIDDDSSAMPSPIPITRTLRPQSHQKLLNEQHLKEYMRTRRVRRGRPRREEYEYKCEEQCAHCGGGWMFDNETKRTNISMEEDDDDIAVNDDDLTNIDTSCDDADVDNRYANDNLDIEERTRLIRCKDCRGAFHLDCMLIHGKEHSEKDAAEDARVEVTNSCTQTNSSSIVEPLSMTTRDPKRCYQCAVNHQKAGGRHLTTSTAACSLSLLEATIENRAVVVRVSIGPLLEANVNGRDMMCIVTLRGRASSSAESLQSSPDDSDDVNYHNDDEIDGSIPPDVAYEIQQLIDKALSNSAHVRLQATSCISLRKYITNEGVTSNLGRLGGIRMLLNSMQCHLDRPNIQAEAMCTLSEIHRVCPQLVEMEMTRRISGCLDLAILAMERHPIHAKVQLMACKMLRTISQDNTKWCSKLKSKKVVSAVVDSIRRNPRKLDVVAEGSTFLQNMIPFIKETTINSVCTLNSRNNDTLPGLIPTIFSVIKASRSDSNHVVTSFCLLSAVARTSKGGALLRLLNVDSLVIDTIQEHFDTPHLHEMAFALLRNVLIVNGYETNATKRSSELINLALKSAMKYPRNKVLQENVCELLVVILSESDGEAQRLVQSKRCRRILTLASENFPESCHDVVQSLLSKT